MDTKLPIKGCSIKEYARRIGISEPTAYRRIKDGVIVVTRIGGRTIVNIEASDANVFGEAA